MSEIIQVNGISIALKACDHCGAVPGELEATQAIRHHADLMGTSLCAVCGEVLMPRAYEISHGADDEGGPRWIAIPEPLTSIYVGLVLSRSGSGIGRGVHAHIECLRRALPFADPELIQVSRFSASWPNPRGKSMA